MKATIRKIQKETEQLSLDELLDLVEDLIHQIKKKNIIDEQSVNWQDLYGLGKGVWKNDAQDYVKLSRAER